MEKQEKALLKNASEFYKEASDSEKEGSYNTAVTLYFKAMSVIIDLFILRKEGKIPSNHSKRFRILESKYPKLYRIMDKDFPLYRDSYRLNLDEEYAKTMRKDVEEVIDFTEVEIKG